MDLVNYKDKKFAWNSISLDNKFEWKVKYVLKIRDIDREFDDMPLQEQELEFECSVSETAALDFVLIFVA